MVKRSQVTFPSHFRVRQAAFAPTHGVMVVAHAFFHPRHYLHVSVPACLPAEVGAVAPAEEPHVRATQAPRSVLAKLGGGEGEGEAGN